MDDPHQQHTPLYDPHIEHDACGIGAVVSLRGEKTWRTVDDALKIVEKLEHRAGKDAAGETGDGVGLMLQIPHKLMMEATVRPKLKVDIVVCKLPVSLVVSTAKKALYTGHIGDGKIFVYDVENVIKVRTGEEGYDALQDDVC